MLLALIFRYEQREQEIDAQAVVSMKVDRLAKTQQNADRLAIGGDAGMGNRDASAKPGTAKAFAGDEVFEKCLGIKVRGVLCGEFGQVFQRAFFA